MVELTELLVLGSGSFSELSGSEHQVPPDRTTLSDPVVPEAVQGQEGQEVVGTAETTSYSVDGVG